MTSRRVAGCVGTWRPLRAYAGLPDRICAGHGARANLRRGRASVVVAAMALSLDPVCQQGAERGGRPSHSYIPATTLAVIPEAGS